MSIRCRWHIPNKVILTLLYSDLNRKDFHGAIDAHRACSHRGLCPLHIMVDLQCLVQSTNISDVYKVTSKNNASLCGEIIAVLHRISYIHLLHSLMPLFDLEIHRVGAIEDTRSFLRYLNTSKYQRHLDEIDSVLAFGKN